MKIGRLWRTIRHLGPSQLAHRVRLRTQRAIMARFPDAARRRAENRASKLALADITAPAMAHIAPIVLAHQNAVHGSHLDGIADANFVLHNERFKFGAIENIDWRGDFREGNNPLRRMTLAYMGYVTPILAQGRAEDLALASRIVQSFDTGNQWNVAGVLGDGWHPYAASHRLINLLAGLALYRMAGGPVDTAQEDVILRHAQLCAVHIHANLERDVQYNHLMKNLVALAVHGAGFEMFPGLEQDIHRTVAQCILKDGGHAERSPMYHLLALLDLQILRACGLTSDTVTRAENALRIMTHPDGDIGLFNDSWFGEGPAASEIIALDDTPETATLETTGYTRLGRGDHAVIFDHGPCGPDDNPAHAHADFLSVELSVGGQRFIVDPGVATYTAGPMRQATRSAASHNGPRLDGEDTLELWGSFRVGRRARAGTLDDAAIAGVAPLCRSGWHNGYRSRGIDARRFVGLWPDDGALICDLWLGDGNAEGKSSFLIPRDWRITSTAPLIFEGDGLTVQVEALTGSISDITPGRYWPRFEMPEQAHGFTLVPTSTGRDSQAALWVSWNDSSTAPDPNILNKLFNSLAHAESGS